MLNPNALQHPGAMSSRPLGANPIVSFRAPGLYVTPTYVLTHGGINPDG